jgi:hypothetical protein
LAERTLGNRHFHCLFLWEPLYAPLLPSRRPNQVLPLLDAALALAQEQLRSQQPDGASLAVKDAVHARLAGLALHRDGWAADVSPGTGGVGAAHLDRLITVVGTVSKAGPVKMLEARRLYECGRCKHRQAYFLGWAPACLPACLPAGACRNACRWLGGSMRGHHSCKRL